MNISQKGIDLIKKYEGLKHQSYQDPVGIWTVGYGHTKTAAPGMIITESDAERLLRMDIDDHVAYIDGYVKVPLNQNQYDALASFIFNVGGGAFIRSTLFKKLNQGDYVGAANEFPRWNKAGGKVLRGLTRRRNEERELFLSKVEMDEYENSDENRMTPDIPKSNDSGSLKDVWKNLVNFVLGVLPRG